MHVTIEVLCLTRSQLLWKCNLVFYIPEINKELIIFILVITSIEACAGTASYGISYIM